MISIHPPTLMLATLIVAAALVLLVLSMRVGLGQGGRGVRTWVAGDVFVLLAQGASLLAEGTAASIPPLTVTTGMITAGIALHVVAIHRHRRPASAHDRAWLAAGPVLGAVVGLASFALPSQAGRSALFSLVLIALIGLNLAYSLWPERRYLGVRVMIGTQLFAIVANLALLAMALTASATVRHHTVVDMVFSLVMPLLTTTAFMLWLQEELRESLNRLAQTDALTGVHNRHGLLPLLQREFQLGQRHDRPLAVAICDLDRFKLINDRLGHDAGDAVLRHFASALKAHLRTSDAVGRWGGEEFIVMFPHTSAAGAAAVLERFRGRPPGSALDQHGPVTFSAGIATTGEAGRSASIEQLIALADRRLYMAKATRDAVVSADSPAQRAGAAAPVPEGMAG